MRVLIVTRKFKEEDERRAEKLAHAAITRLLPDTDTVLRDEELDWLRRGKLEGSIDAAYRWAGTTFHQYILIVHGRRSLARGQFEIARQALKHGRTVRMWDNGRMPRAARVELANLNNWREGYANVVLEDDDVGVDSDR